jgi:hypothetical protein
MVAVAQTVAYMSTNFGKNWQEISNLPDSYMGYAGININANSSIMVCVSNDPAHIYVTTNYGASWLDITNPSQTWGAVSMSNDGKFMLAPTNVQLSVYLSKNSGSSWAVISDLPAMYWSASAVSGTGQYMYAVNTGDGGNNGGGTVFLSNNFGASWSPSPAPQTGFNQWSGITTDASGINLVLINYDGYIYYSSDSGASWTQSTGAPVALWNDVASSSSGQYVAAVNAGDITNCAESIYASTTYGQSFYVLPPPSESSCFSMVSLNSNGSLAIVGNSGYDMYIGTDIFSPVPTPRPTSIPTRNPTAVPTKRPTFYPTYATDTSAVTFSTASLGAYAFTGAAISSSGTYLAVSVESGSESGVWISSNNGVTWTASSLPPGTSSASWDVLRMSSTGQYMAVASNNGMSIYYSNDYGQDWYPSEAPALKWEALAVSSSGQYVYVNIGPTTPPAVIYMSTDYGEIFNPTESGTEQWTDMAICGTVAYAGTEGGKLYSSSVGTLQWTVVSQDVGEWLGIACNTAGSLMIAGLALDSAVSELPSLYTSKDNGVTWSVMSSPPSEYFGGVVGSSDLSVLASVGANLDYDDLNFEGLYVSVNSGSTWELTSAPTYAGITALAMTSDGSTLVVAAGSIVLLGTVADINGGGGSDASTLSSGAVAGIVISVLFVVAAAVAAIVFKEVILNMIVPTSSSNGIQETLAPSPVKQAVVNPMSGAQQASTLNSEL